MKKKLKIKLENLEKYITIYNCILITIIILLLFLLKKGIIPFIEYECIFGLYSVVNLIIIFVAIYNKKFKINIIDIFMLFLSIFAIISFLLSKYHLTSFIGATNRYEGLIMILSYYILFTSISIIKNVKYKKRIILIFLVLSIFQLREKLFTIKNAGLIDHHNFFATYTLLVYSLSIGLFIFTKDKKLKYIYLLISTIFLQKLVYSVTSSVLVSLIFIYIAIIGYIIIITILKLFNKIDKKRLKCLTSLYIKTGICLLIILFSYIFIYRNNVEITKENKYALNDLNKIKNGNIDNQFGSERGYIWKEAIKVVPKYWLHGVGIDCFEYAFNPRLETPIHKRYVDKAHNEYLQILITEGVFSCTTYILFLLYIFFSSIKYIMKNETLDNSIYIPLFLAFLGYSIQAFANIRVINVAPFFFIITGLLTNRYKRLD